MEWFSVCLLWSINLIPQKISLVKLDILSCTKFLFLSDKQAFCFNLPNIFPSLATSCDKLDEFGGLEYFIVCGMAELDVSCFQAHTSISYLESLSAEWCSRLSASFVIKRPRVQRSWRCITSGMVTRDLHSLANSHFRFILRLALIAKTCISDW